MKIAFIGHGNVGGALAGGLQRTGHAVAVGARDPAAASVRALLARNPALAVAAPSDAVRSADVIFLATPFQAAPEVLGSFRGELAGKVLVDCTNPVGPGLTHGLSSRQSGTELLQALVPATAVVKAFSVYGFENFEGPAVPIRGIRPMMPFCGDDASAKASVAGLIAGLGWDPLDVGGATQALHLEHMTLLWIRLVRAGGRSPRLVWAALQG